MTADWTAAAALRAPFPRETIGKLPKPYKKDSPKGDCPECGSYHGLPAMHLDYVGHAAAVDRLLTVDPSWTWEPLATDDHGLPALDRDGNLWIRLTVAGVSRIGVGDGPDAKQRISDAIRNAAMRFGVALDLWAKEDLWAMHIETDADWLAAQRQAIADAKDGWALDAVKDEIKAQVADGRVAGADRAELSDLWLARKAEIEAAAA